MIVAVVTDTLVSTRKHSALQGVKLLVVKPLGQELPLIAGDILGAGVGEYVMITCGCAASGALDKPAPVDAMVVGILDAPPAFAKG